jgi:hypothetical protein
VDLIETTGGFVTHRQVVCGVRIVLPLWDNKVVKYFHDLKTKHSLSETNWQIFASPKIFLDEKKKNKNNLREAKIFAE